MSAEIKEMIAACETCRRFETSPQKETLMPHAVPSRPWAKVGIDLFSFDNKDFLVTVHYYSNFWEIDKVVNTRAPKQSY